MLSHIEEAISRFIKNRRKFIDREAAHKVERR